MNEWRKIKETPWYEEALESAIDEKRKRRKMKRLEKQYENAKQDYNDAQVVYREKIFQKSLNNPDRKDGGGGEQNVKWIDWRKNTKMLYENIMMHILHTDDKYLIWMIIINHWRRA